MVNYYYIICCLVINKTRQAKTMKTSDQYSFTTSNAIHYISTVLVLLVSGFIIFNKKTLHYFYLKSLISKSKDLKKKEDTKPLLLLINLKVLILNMTIF